MSVPPAIVVALLDVVGDQIALYGWQGCAADIGVLFINDLTGAYQQDLVPVLGDARSVIEAIGLATVYP